MKIKELPKEFERKGVRYKQLVKETHDSTDEGGGNAKDGYFIYECSDLECGYSYYEVFRYRLVPRHPLSNEDYDMIEAYPTDKHFGLNAWCCSDKDDVMSVMRRHFGISHFDLDSR